MIRAPREHLLVVVLGAVTSVALVGAQEGPSDDWNLTTARLEQAATEGSAPGLKRAHEDLSRRARRDRAPLVHYAIAYMAWRMAFLSGVPREERNAMLDDGVARLEAVISANPQDAEAMALLAGLYAAQIGRSPLKAIVRGPRASGTLARAEKLAPSNPRVALQAGIGAFHTPRAFGGGSDKAERLLRRSLELFDHEPLDQPWPNWGRVDAHAWLGQVLMRNGDRAGARAEYDKALALAPDSGWVKHVLLPALERRAKP